MKIFAFLAAGAFGAQQLSSLKKQVESHYSQYEHVSKSVSSAEAVEVELNQMVKRDESIKGFIKGQTRSNAKWCPVGDNCQLHQEVLHWDLCPNMCQMDYEKDYIFAAIRGSKMQQYKTFEDKIVEQRDAIVRDLEGKASQIYDQEEQVKSTRMNMEKLQDAFLLQLGNDLRQARNINEGLNDISQELDDIQVKFQVLKREIKAAHVDCEEQAPCMAVPRCKIGAASASSCADIVNQSMDKDEDGGAVNYAGSGLYIIAPPGLGPKLVNCENDQVGGAYTVFQQRTDGGLDFNRNWREYRAGFGTAADLNHPECEAQEYWLGNDYLFQIQSQSGKNSLKLDMSRSNGERGVVKYTDFKIAGPQQKFKILKANGFEDDTCGVQVGDSLSGSAFGAEGYGRNDQKNTVHVGMKFSTSDQDNDKNRNVNCAEQDSSGWWFNSCSAANLNGIYHGGPYSARDTGTGEFDDGILWHSWTRTKFEALTKTKMSLGSDSGMDSRMCDNVGATVAPKDNWTPTDRTDTDGGNNDGEYDPYDANSSYNYY